MTYELDGICTAMKWAGDTTVACPCGFHQSGVPRRGAPHPAVPDYRQTVIAEAAKSALRFHYAHCDRAGG